MVCEEYCEYDDCSEERGITCWVETCDDGCGVSNCTIWLNENDEWYGELCPDMGMDIDFDGQEAIAKMQGAVSVYEDTINTMMEAFC